MNIAILQRELDELQNDPQLFDVQNFRVRKEALDFVDVIGRFTHEENAALLSLQTQASAFGERLRTFNASLGQDFYDRLTKERPTPENFRMWLRSLTNCSPQRWGEPHHGYDNLDFLLDEILLPHPHPQPNLRPEYGMVRYEPTPASVILELIERIQFNENDLFCDLGSGLGKVTLLVHLLTGVRCIGVEYQPGFCSYAGEQASRLNLDKVSYLNIDARHADYTDATVFFLFNPFGGFIFDTVLENLWIESQKRQISICSYGSSSQPLSELTWLEQVPPIGSDEMALAVFRG